MTLGALWGLARACRRAGGAAALAAARTIDSIPRRTTAHESSRE